MLIFLLLLKMVYSQSDESGILDVLEIKISLEYLFLILSVDFTFWWWDYCNFLKGIKKLKLSKILLPLPEILKNLRG